MRTVALIAVLTLICAIIVTESSTITGNNGTFLATFDTEYTSGASGYFNYSTDGSGASFYSMYLDLQSFSIPQSAVDNDCTLDIIKTSGLKYHIHTYWTNTTADSSYLCSSTSAHFDPALACSANSENYAGFCTDLNRTAANGYTYACSSAVFASGNYSLCEDSDLSGKFGVLKAISTDSTSSEYLKFNALIENDPTSPAVKYYEGTDAVATYPWHSIVFHCPVTTGTTANPRLFCGKLKKVDYIQPNTYTDSSSNSNGDSVECNNSNISPKWKVFSITYLILSLLLIAYMIHYIIKLRGNQTKENLLSQQTRV